MNRRGELTRAIQLASDVRHEHVKTPTEAVDILGITLDMGAQVMFQPLPKLLGATIRVDDQVGVIVTTKRPRSVQRFTLAHELGHIVLGHNNKFDESVCFANQGASGRLQDQETAADTFAAELLAPAQALEETMLEWGWGREEAIQPANIYQVGLRLGISFQAALHAFRNAEIITWDDVKRFTSQAHLLPSIKKSAAKESLQDRQGDAWILSEHDHGKHLEAGPADVFTINLDEQSTSGYRWNLDNPSEVSVFDDQTMTGPRIGSPSLRSLTRQPIPSKVHELTLAQRRPWNQEVCKEWHVEIDNRGKETEGLPRRLRERRLSGARA